MFVFITFALISFFTIKFSELRRRCEQKKQVGVCTERTLLLPSFNQNWKASTNVLIFSENSLLDSVKTIGTLLNHFLITRQIYLADLDEMVYRLNTKRFICLAFKVPLNHVRSSNPFQTYYLCIVHM